MRGIIISEIVYICLLPPDITWKCHPNRGSCRKDSQMHAAFLWDFERLFYSVIIWACETRCSPVFHNRNHIADHIEQQTEILRTRARVLLRAGPTAGFLFVATRSWITARIIKGSLRLMDFQSGDRGARRSCLSVMNLPAIRSWVVRLSFRVKEVPFLRVRRQWINIAPKQ